MIVRHVATVVIGALLALASPGCSPGPLALPPGPRGEVCAVGDRVLRTCAAGLTCTSRTVVPAYPWETRSVDGERCGGFSGNECLRGLTCVSAYEDRYVADASGTCRRSSTCERETTR